jgi:GNAT superfamily N-acetyltransferase
MRALVAGGGVPGLLAYAGAVPAGWCSVAPRETYAALERSRILKPVDDQPVWSVVCFFIAKAARRQGLTVALLRAAVDHARSRSARILEGYPKDLDAATTPDVFAWHGTASAFRQAGFTEVARRAPTRPIMRYEVKE